jgi:hypothetical protein
MTPEDLELVRHSWTELRRRRAVFVERLAAALATMSDPATAGERADRLVGAADDLLDALATPSELAERARVLAVAWPTATPLPRLAVDGVAWRRAAAAVCRPWTQVDDAAWHRAWLLLDDLLDDLGVHLASPPPT